MQQDHQIELEDILAIKLLNNSNLSTRSEEAFDFEALKEAACGLLHNFFEDIITLQEKVKFTEFAVSNEIQNIGKLDLFMMDLRESIRGKLTKLFQSANTIESAQSGTPRMEYSSGDNLDFQKIQNLLKEKITSRLP